MVTTPRPTVTSHTGRTYNGDSTTLHHLVNLLQLPEERREKYHSLRRSGLAPSFARRLRDWREVRIALFLTYLHKRGIL